MTKKIDLRKPINVVHDNCLEGMKKLKDNSVDLVCIDPPYNIGKDKSWDKWKTFADTTGLKEINKPMMNKINKYMNEELSRLGLIPNDINKLFWEAGYNKRGSNIATHYFGNNGQNSLPTKDKYEKIQKLTGGFKKPYSKLRKEYEEIRLQKESERYTFNNQKTHHSVWNYSIAPNIGHPTSKPVDLIENILKHSSNEGDVVLDCFGGSGSTAVACKNLNRIGIIIEREEKYIKIIKDRLKNVK